MNYVYGVKSVEVLGTVHPDLKRRMLCVYEELFSLHDVSMDAHSGLRCFSEQMKLWMKGRNERGIVINPNEVVTKSRPGSSWHNYGLAVDSKFRGNDPYGVKMPDGTGAFLWSEYGRLCVKNGLTWGGDWNGNGIKDKNDFDRVHAECRYGMSLDEVKQIYDDGGLQGVFESVDFLNKGGSYG